MIFVHFVFNLKCLFFWLVAEGVGLGGFFFGLEKLVKKCLCSQMQ